MGHQQDSAEVVALQAVAWLAGNDVLLPLFLSATGAELEDLRSRIAEEGFLVAVMDFIMMEDAWLIEFCDHSNLSYDTPERVRQMLPGGARVHWT